MLSDLRHTPLLILTSCSLDKWGCGGLLTQVIEFLNVLDELNSSWTPEDPLSPQTWQRKKSVKDQSAWDPAEEGSHWVFTGGDQCDATFWIWIQNNKSSTQTTCSCTEGQRNVENQHVITNRRVLKHLIQIKRLNLTGVFCVYECTMVKVRFLANYLRHMK